MIESKLENENSTKLKKHRNTEKLKLDKKKTKN